MGHGTGHGTGHGGRERRVRLTVRGAATLAALGAAGPVAYAAAGIVRWSEALAAGLLLASVAVAVASAIVSDG